jgi:hypothetical protein
MLACESESALFDLVFAAQRRSLGGCGVQRRGDSKLLAGRGDRASSWPGAAHVWLDPGESCVQSGCVAGHYEY